MTVHDLWKDLPKSEVARRREAGRVRWQRRWRGPDLDPRTGRPKQHKQSYREHQRAEAHLDDAKQMGQPKARRIAAGSITVDTLLDRHLAAKADRAPKTVEADRHHAGVVRDAFGDRVLSTIDTTEVETWTQRADVARHSRKKQLEILRAAIRRGVRDGLVEADPTDGIVVALGHKERPHWSLDELMAVLEAAPADSDRALLGVLGLMGVRSGEARTLVVGDLAAGRLTVRTAGSGTDTTKTRSSLRTLPVPASVLPWLEQQAGGRPRAAWLFPSPRRKGEPIAERYAGDALTRATARANEARSEPIPRLNVHGLRHTFAAVALSEAEANLVSVSRMLGHSRPSTTLNYYGHLAPSGLDQLVASIDDLVTPGAPQVRPENS